MITYFTNIFIKIKSNLNNLNLFNYYIIKKPYVIIWFKLKKYII